MKNITKNLSTYKSVFLIDVPITILKAINLSVYVIVIDQLFLSTEVYRYIIINETSQ